MSIDEIVKAVQMMNDSGEEILTTGGASDSLIQKAEAALGVTFPQDYRYFLKEFGSLCFESEEFYGLTKAGLDADSIPSMIFATNSARERSDISNQMIKIKSSGYGPVFSIDLSQIDEGGSSPVVETQLSFKRDEGKVTVAKSFGEFFLSEIETAIEDL